MKIVLLAPSDAYLFNFRGALAAALHAAGHEVLMVAPPGPFASKFKALGYRWCPAPMVRAGMNPLKELWLIGWLYRFLRREKVDLVHGFIIKGAVYGALAGRLAGVPARVGSITGLGYLFLNDSMSSRMMRRLVRVLFRLAFTGDGVRVVVQNRDDLALFMNERLARAEIMRMIPGSGVDCELFAPRERADTRPGRRTDVRDGRAFRVLLPARLLWHKGLKEYSEASRLLRANNRTVSFLLAGEFDASNPSSIEPATIQGWVREGLIEWLGYVDNMPELLRSVDVVVLPSFREGLPKALVEGAACALPLVTTDVPGCREVVADNVDGLLVPEKNPEALAEAIGRLQDDPELRLALGRAARKKSLARFDSRVILRQTFELYRELLPQFDNRPMRQPVSES